MLGLFVALGGGGIFFASPQFDIALFKIQDLLPPPTWFLSTPLEKSKRYFN